MSISPAVIELVEALRRSYSGNASEPSVLGNGKSSSIPLQAPSRLPVRKGHVADVSTVTALSQRRNGSTLRILADTLGLPRNAIATLSNVLRERPGSLTVASENDLRQRLGLLPLPEPFMLTPCQSCLERGITEVHTAGDCHGAPIAAVVILAPGEVVRQNGHAPARERKDERGTLHVEKALIAEINERRGDMTQAAYIRKLMEAR